jgi:Ni,Fe-hydrogenase III large subunit
MQDTTETNDRSTSAAIRLLIERIESLEKKVARLEERLSHDHEDLERLQEVAMHDHEDLENLKVAVIPRPTYSGRPMVGL